MREQWVSGGTRVSRALSVGGACIPLSLRRLLRTKSVLSNTLSVGVYRGGLEQLILVEDAAVRSELRRGAGLFTTPTGRRAPRDAEAASSVGEIIRDMSHDTAGVRSRPGGYPVERGVTARYRGQRAPGGRDWIAGKHACVSLCFVPYSRMTVVLRPGTWVIPRRLACSGR
jgi:hypothetical protein